MAATRRSATPTMPDTASLLLCADTMATYSAPSPFIYPLTTTVATGPYQGKIYPLPHGFYCAFCDDYHWSHQIATELYGRMANLKPSSPGFRDEIKVEIENSFEYAFLWLRPEVLRNDVGIVLDEYLKGPLDPNLRADAQAALQNAARNIPAELIIAGQTPRGPLLLRANGTEIREITEYAASGGPVESAINWFRFRGQQSSMSIPRSFFHMLEAKKFCELDPTVGRDHQFVLIPPTGPPSVLQDRGALSSNWISEFGLRPTNVLDTPDRRISFETSFNLKLTP